MKKLTYIFLLTLLGVTQFTLHAQEEDTLIIPPTKIILKTSLSHLIPNYIFNYSSPYIGVEYYAGKDISVGFSGGTYFTNNIKQYPYRNLFLNNVKITDVFGGYFNIEFKRFFGNKERSEHSHLLFPLISLQNKNTKAENTGYYLGILLTEKFTNVFYDYTFGKSTISSSQNFFSFSFDITIGYQSISQKGWTLDQTFGIGFTKGSILTESLIEYNLFHKINSEVYPHLSYSFKIGKEFEREFKVKER